MTGEMLRYKLTNKDGYTRRKQSGETLWRPGTVRQTAGHGDLCSSSWTHVYTDPLLAVLLDPIHANYGPKAQLIEVECSGCCATDHGLKEGWTMVRFVRHLPRPKLTSVQKIAFGILCAMEVHEDSAWRAWADAWLTGQDRSADAANAAADAARSAANAARSAADAASYAARSAALDLVGLARRALTQERFNDHAV